MRPLLIHSAYAWGRRTEGWLANQLAEIDGWNVVALAARSDGAVDPSAVRCLAEDHPVLFALDRIWARLTGSRWTLPYRRMIWEAGHRPAGAVVIHAHFGEWGYALLPLARSLGARLVVSFYGYDAGSLPRRRGWARRLVTLFHHASAVVAEGPAMRARLESLGCPREKLVVVPLGVDLGQWPEQARHLRPDAPVRMLVVASLREKKGVDDAIRLFARARPWLPPGSTLTVVGDGPLRRPLVRLAETLDVARAIEWTGHLPLSDVRRLLYEADVLLQPSVTASDGDTEGGAPVILLQAAAAGLPVVATRHADIPYVVTDGVTGCLADERDVAGLEAALRRVLDDYDRLSVNARAVAAERFSITLTRDRLRKLYESLVEAGRTGAGLGSRG